MIESATVAGISGGRVWLTAAAFATLFPALSFLINRRLCGGQLRVDISRLALLVALTFLAAIVCEAVINPMYETAFSEKLWEYRLLPLHDRNVSALALLVWTAYGIHLYFLLQWLDRRAATPTRQRFYQACFIGVEAPLLWEVSGNAFFLIFAGEFYAYYLPQDMFHFTSLRVVPLYVGAVYFGLSMYERLCRSAQDWAIAGLCFSAGLLFLAAGQ